MLWMLAGKLDLCYPCVWLETIGRTMLGAWGIFKSKEMLHVKPTKLKVNLLREFFFICVIYKRLVDKDHNGETARTQVRWYSEVFLFLFLLMAFHSTFLSEQTQGQKALFCWKTPCSLPHPWLTFSVLPRPSTLALHLFHSDRGTGEDSGSYLLTGPDWVTQADARTRADPNRQTRTACHSAGDIGSAASWWDGRRAGW